MATLQDTDIRDLVTGTLKELGRMRFNQIAQRIQNYEVMGRILRQDKVTFDAGVGIQRTIMIDHSGSARQTGLHEVDVVTIGDVLITMDVPWRRTTAHYGYERREILENRSDERIVDLLKVRRTDAMISTAEQMESQFWNKPADSTNKLDIFGVPYWIVKNATEGFNGGNPAGFTAGAGNISSTTYPRWANYTANFAAFTKADAVKKLRLAYEKIRFKSPVDVPDFRMGKGDQYRLYVNIATKQAFEELGENQNENLGRDIAAMDGVITFRRNPVIWVPQLDADTDNPIYMINFAWFAPFFLKGDFLRETEPDKVSGQHNSWVVFVDTSWNVLCTNRREQAVVYGTL